MRPDGSRRKPTASFTEHNHFLCGQSSGVTERGIKTHRGGRRRSFSFNFLFLDVCSSDRNIPPEAFPSPSTSSCCCFAASSHSPLRDNVLHVCRFPGNRKEQIRWISGVRCQQQGLCFPVLPRLTSQVSSSSSPCFYTFLSADCTCSHTELLAAPKSVSTSKTTVCSKIMSEHTHTHTVRSILINGQLSAELCTNPPC